MKIEKEAEKLVKSIYQFIDYIDKVMKKPSSEQRGKEIAKGITFLEINTDSFAHYTLKFGFKKISNMKKKKVSDEQK